MNCSIDSSLKFKISHFVNPDCSDFNTTDSLKADPFFSKNGINSLKDLDKIKSNLVNALLLIKDNGIKDRFRSNNKFMSDKILINNTKSKRNSFDSIILDLLIRSYYQENKSNCPGNYDNYVDNSLEIISHFPDICYFKKKFNEVKKAISKQNSHFYNSSKKLILIDLDETLIHSDIDLKFKTHSIYLKIKTKEGIKLSIPINVRPFAIEFIELISQYYDIAIFTASTKDYADPIIDYLDKKNCIKYRFYREHCISYKTFQFKILEIFDRPLHEVVIIENNIYSFSLNLDNGILVSSFYNDFNDIELFSLFDFLIDVVYQSFDVRESISEMFGFSQKLTSLKLKRNNFCKK